MARYLVIVESPAKVKTIKKFLGSNYVVTASNGHVRDLPKSQLGIDVEHDFEPKYITIRGKGDILANLRKEVKKADKVYLATGRQKDVPYQFQRDYQECGKSIDQRRKRDRYESGRCTAGKKSVGSNCWL